MCVLSGMWQISIAQGNCIRKYCSVTCVCLCFRRARASVMAGDIDVLWEGDSESVRAESQYDARSVRSVRSFTTEDVRSVRSFTTEEWNTWKERFRRDTLRYKSVYTRAVCVTSHPRTSRRVCSVARVFCCSRTWNARRNYVFTSRVKLF